MTFVWDARVRQLVSSGPANSSSQLRQYQVVLRQAEAIDLSSQEPSMLCENTRGLVLCGGGARPLPSANEKSGVGINIHFIVCRSSTTL
jgi:hypothetical protein